MGALSQICHGPARERARRIGGMERDGGQRPTIVDAIEYKIPLIFPSLLFFAGVSDGGRRILLRATLICGGVLLAAIASRIPLIVLACPVYLYIEYQLLRSKAAAHSDAFEKDYPALILSLASSVKAGNDPLDAMLRAKDLFDVKGEMHRELRMFSASIEAGRSKEDSIAKFATSIDHPDIQLFRTALILNQHEGASVADCLQRLVRVTRSRQSFRRKIKAALAMQKLSSIGIAFSFIGIGLFQLLSNRRAMLQAWEHPLGNKALMLALLLMGVGFVWMSRLVKTSR